MQQLHRMQQANAVLLDRLETESALKPAAARASEPPLAPPATAHAEAAKTASAVGAAAEVVKPLLQDCMAVKGSVKPYTVKDFVEGKPTM